MGSDPIWNGIIDPIRAVPQESVRGRQKLAGDQDPQFLTKVGQRPARDAAPPGQHRQQHLPPGPGPTPIPRILGHPGAGPPMARTAAEPVGDDPDYLQARDYVHTVKVTNDLAERGVKKVKKVPKVTYSSTFSKMPLCPINTISRSCSVP